MTNKSTDEEIETTIGVKEQAEEREKDELEFTVSFKLTSKDHENLEKYAKDKEMSKSLIIRTAVKKFIEEKVGIIEAKLPMAVYNKLKFLIDEGEVMSIEAAVSEAVNEFALKKAREIAEFRNARLLKIKD